MRLLEFESKNLLKEAGFEIPKGQLATSDKDVIRIAQEISMPIVLKPQIPVGGRGKAGLLLFIKDRSNITPLVKKILHKDYKGYAIKNLLVEEQLKLKQEIYLSVTYEADSKCPVLLASNSGGIDIEKMTKTITRHYFSPLYKWHSFQSREVARQLGFTGHLLILLTNIIDRLISIFLELDALLVEINPLVLTIDDRFVVVDAHIELDNDALFRHPDLIERFGISRCDNRPLNEFEKQAADIDNTDHRGVAGRMVQFDGDLGLLIGGGGASLTIFDALLDAGLNPANYCEIGGNPSVWKVKELTKLILKQPKVNDIAVIMNIVSNTRVDLIARGVIKGILELGHDPAKKIIAFRVPGSWEEEGFAILRHYNINFYTREISIDEVVKKIAEWGNEKK